MANYAILKSDLDAVIKTNIRRSITGDVLNHQLDSMIDSLGTGYQYMGLANPATNPGTPDSREFYLATVPGNYEHFGNLQLPEGKLACFRYDGTWKKDEFQFSLVIDATPSYDSSNPVMSGGVYSALSEKENSSNKVKTLSPSSNNEQYPTAKCVYDLISGLTEPFDYEVVPILPTASASTMGTIYVLTEETSSTFYLTKKDGNTYSWAPIGVMATSITAITNGQIDALFEY